MKVYLDNAATAPIKKEVLEAMQPYLTINFGNPSSIHQWGRIARKAVDEAREKVANFMGAEVSEVIFTSGGTEADNLAITGVIAQISKSARGARHAIRNPKQILNSKFQIQKPHIITSQFEHHAVLRTCEELEKEGLAEITYIKPNKEGIIEVEAVKKALRPNTFLVTIIYVNNEIGTIQPIREIGKMIEKENENRARDLSKSKNFSRASRPKAVLKPQIYFHTDAVQAAEYLPINVDYLHVDMLTIAGHKIGAPKGVGALYVRKGTPLENIIFGGEQELGKRAGTENVAGTVALGKAVEVISYKKLEIRNKEIIKLRDYFIRKVLKEISETKLNGSAKYRAPHNANIYFKFIEGESIVIAMDLKGVACSTGSACTSQSLEPSHVIMAVYDDSLRAAGSVRFSLGEKTTKKDLNYTVKTLKEVIKRLRKISPYSNLKKHRKI